jgi:uncharacterized membrane protein
MRGIILVFVSICILAIGWRHCSLESRDAVKNFLKANILSVILAWVFVSIAIFFSLNTTVRLV